MQQIIILILFVVVQYAVALLPMVDYEHHQHARLREQLEWTKNSESTSASSSSSSTSSGKCVNANNAPSIKAPKTNVWNSLTDAETSSVTKWLLAQPDLNLTSVDKATSWDNTILLVEVMNPNKTDALKYLDQSGPIPTQYAHVLIDHSASIDPYYADLLVGPLPIQTGVTQWQQLEYPYTRKTQGRVRNLDANDEALVPWIYEVSSSIADITLALWNGTARGLSNDTLGLTAISPAWQNGDRVISWYQFFNLPTGKFDTVSLLPLGLSFQADVTGRDPSQWKMEGWVYNNIYYKTTDEFRAAFHSPGFQKLGANVDGLWGSTDQQGPAMPQDQNYPPTPITPSGSRYSIDIEQRYVTWMDFSFYIGFSRDTGLALYDIRFKGKRIIYELGLQEALAHYAGIDPTTSGAAYLDSFSGFGADAFELVQGYDCPTYATYLNSSIYSSQTNVPYPNNICLFEFLADFPLQRHTAVNYASNTKNVYFTVRSISTVGNYDYLFSYSFYLDGSITVEVRASGYIHAAFYAQNSEYGYRIHDNLSGSMHDHVLNFKADFDILGQANTIEFVKPVPVSQAYVWSGGQIRNTMKLQRSFLENEDTGRFNWADDARTQVLVVNKDQPNQYGELPGYRILPYAGTASLTVQGSSNLANAANWAGYDLQITRQHDTEPRSAHAYNLEDVHDPPIDFNHFFNGESLDQQDLVVWFNLGMHHLPSTADLPNTMFSIAHSGVQFVPANYLSSDPSRQTVNMVRIDYASSGTSAAGTPAVVDVFGQQDLQCQLQFVPAELGLNTYVGEPSS